MRAYLLASILLGVAGCSTWQQTAYYTGQAWQQNQCQKISDPMDRQNCLRKADTKYDDYKRQTEEGNK